MLFRAKRGVCHPGKGDFKNKPIIRIYIKPTNLMEMLNFTRFLSTWHLLLFTTKKYLSSVCRKKNLIFQQKAEFPHHGRMWSFPWAVVVVCDVLVNDVFRAVVLPPMPGVLGYGQCVRQMVSCWGRCNVGDSMLVHPLKTNQLEP